MEEGRRLVHGSTCACASSGTIAMRQVSCESQTNMPVNFELWTLLLLHVLLLIPTLCAVVQCNVVQNILYMCILMSYYSLLRIYMYLQCNVSTHTVCFS